MRPLIALELTASADDLIGDELLHCRELHDGLRVFVGLGGVVLGYPGEYLYIWEQGTSESGGINI